METPASYFDRFGKSVITIIGSGGKTSLLWALAAHRRGERTLVTTTTRMQLPETAPAGVALAGIVVRDEMSAAKFRSLPLDALETLIPHYDYVFIEGDGSRTLPLKGWADYEPVVTASTKVTVGIMPLWTLGKPVSAALVHRLPLWLELTGAREGELIAAKHLARAIAGWHGRKGLLSAARGKRVLFFNQIEDEAALDRAREVAALLPADCAAGLDGVIAGSVRLNTAHILRGA